MHADDRGINHLDSGIMGSGECVYDPTPHASPPPANEAVVASGVGTERIRQIAPGCSRSQDKKMPLRIRRSFTRGTLASCAFCMLTIAIWGSNLGSGLCALRAQVCRVSLDPFKREQCGGSGDPGSCKLTTREPHLNDCRRIRGWQQM
jgi:hypothetical protein